MLLESGSTTDGLSTAAVFCFQGNKRWVRKSIRLLEKEYGRKQILAAKLTVSGTKPCGLHYEGTGTRDVMRWYGAEIFEHVPARGGKSYYPAIFPSDAQWQLLVWDLEPDRQICFAFTNHRALFSLHRNAPIVSKPHSALH